MILFEKFTLANGLRVLVHEDDSTPMAVVNILYDVGAKDENPEKTGFAHLFEHLMFGGSKNIPVYDEPLQVAGGENNAFTTNDLTNYYCQLPAENIETAFWLESDRMLSLAFGKKSLEVQRKVVCEEFKEHYINKPYGDVWHKLRNMVYTTHPYKWMTIGASLKHVEDATLADVKGFFKKHYNPANAILTVAGNIKTAQVKELVEKWFGTIPAGKKYNRNLPVEPKQIAPKTLEVKADVPLDALYKCWHIYPRTDDRYYTADLITDINSLPDIFYTSSRGVNETNIVVSSSINHLVDKHFTNEKLIQKLDNLASITVKLPKENIVVPGIYYFIFQRLAWEGIIINEVISTSNEFTILVSEDQVDVAFKVIKDLKN